MLYAGVVAVSSPPALTCTKSGIKVTCNGFLPSSPPGLLISSSGLNGVTINAATLQGRSIMGSKPAFVVPTLTSKTGDALLVATDGQQMPVWVMAQVNSPD